MANGKTRMQYYKGEDKKLKTKTKTCENENCQWLVAKHTATSG